MRQMPLYRIVRIVWMAMSFFIQNIFFQKRYRDQFTPSIQQKWDQMMTLQAKKFKKLALELGGLMVKIGQFLSARADIMPSSFIKEMEGLTDSVTPVPPKKALAFLQEEIGEFIQSGCISAISERPVASASIGDVYKGKLSDGTDIAIKIQRSNIEKILRADFKALKIVIGLLKRFTTFGKQLNLDLLYQEMTQTIGTELDYMQEIKNGKQFSKRFADQPGISFPVYFEQYSTHRVLVMEWIEGAKVTDLDFLVQHTIHPQALAERLFHFFLSQILEGGQVHADPHSGNLLVQADGTIVVIDFGMIITITKEDAASILLIIESLLFKQYDRVVDGLEQLNFLLEHADHHAIEKVVQQTVEAYEAHDLHDVNSMAVHQILEDLQAVIRTQPVQLPVEFAFLGRAASIFTGVLHVLDPTIDLFAIAKPQIIQWAGKRLAFERFFSKKEAERLTFEAIGKIRDFQRKVISLLDEPARMRNYMDQRHKEQYREKMHLQTRQFTGLAASVSLSFTLIGLWMAHTILFVSAGFIFFLSIFIFWRQAKHK